jgi:hypothetical protein
MAASFYRPWADPPRERVTSTIDTEATLTSFDVGQLTGLTYRQLNWLAIKLHWNPGSGSRRLWSRRQVHQLRIAVVLNNAAAANDVQRFALAVINGPPPPATGWVVYQAGSISYGPSPAVALKGLDGGIVARIPQDTP